MTVGVRDMVAELEGRVATASASEVHDALAAGAVDFLIDVRDAAEFQQGHLPGARNVSRGTLEPTLDPTTPMADPGLAGKWDAGIVVYCMRGPGFRSLAAADTLARMGYTNVKALAGGLDAWKQQGLPVEAGAGQ